MSATDCRTLHVYRLPVYQKRIIGNENQLPNPYTRSPSPYKSAVISRRRHSTPPASANRLVDVHSTPTNLFFKHQHYRTKDQNLTTNSAKTSPSRPISLVKLRYQEDRHARLATTPTSINSFTDVILPVAKKNINTIVQTPTSITSEMQSSYRHISTIKRGKGISIDLERDICLPNEDFAEKSTRDTTSKLKGIKWFNGSCPCHFSHCNFCHWYCSCPFWCWVIGILLLFFSFFGVFIVVRVLSDH